MFEKFNLKEESFPVAPGGSKNAVWYGFRGLKKQFEDSIDRSTRNPMRHCVLNRGQIGTGKTNAAHYFTRYLSNCKDMGIYGNALSFVMEAPTQPNRAFLEFSQRFNDVVTFSNILNASEKIKESYGPERLFNDLMELTGNEDISTALSNINSSNRLTIRTYLAGGGTTKDLKEIGVSRKLTNDHDFALSIVGILHILLNGSFEEKGKISRLFLWIDEMDDLVFFPTKYFLPFTQALRELIDNMSEHFTLFLNFTYSEPAELSTIETVVGEALVQRIDSHILFDGAGKEDLTEYFLELLSNNRIRKNQETDKYYPFMKDSFEMIIDSAVGRTPRYLNKLCSNLLKNIAAEAKYNFKEGKRIEISVIQKELPSILAYLDNIRS